MKIKQTKVFQLGDIEFKSDDEGNPTGEVVAYASMFGNVDDGNDRMVKGAFKRTLAARDSKIIYLPSHDYGAHIASIPAVPVSIEEDTKGLRTVSKFLLNTTAGRDSYEVLKAYQDAGRPLGLSFTFRIVKSDYVHEKIDGKSTQIREIKDVELYEYGHCPLPMNEEARTVSVKAGDVQAKGNVTTLGSKFTGAMYSTLTGIVASMLSNNSLSAEEAIMCTNAVVDQFDGMLKSLGDLADREIESNSWWDSWTLDPSNLNANAHDLIKALVEAHNETCNDASCALHDSSRVKFASLSATDKLAHYYDEAKTINSLLAGEYVDNLPDSAFAVIKSGGTKDSEGKTAPRSLRMLPHHDDAGEIVNEDCKSLVESSDLTDSERTEALSHFELHGAAASKERVDIDALEKLLVTA